MDPSLPGLDQAAERYAKRRLGQLVQHQLLAGMPVPGGGGYAAAWRGLSGGLQPAAEAAGYHDPGFYLRQPGGDQVMQQRQAMEGVTSPPASPQLPQLGGRLAMYEPPPPASLPPLAPPAPIPPGVLGEQRAPGVPFDKGATPDLASLIAGMEPLPPAPAQRQRSPDIAALLAALASGAGVPFGRPAQPTPAFPAGPQRGHPFFGDLGGGRRA